MAFVHKIFLLSSRSSHHRYIFYPDAVYLLTVALLVIVATPSLHATAFLLPTAPHSVTRDYPGRLYSGRGRKPLPEGRGARRVKGGARRRRPGAGGPTRLPPAERTSVILYHKPSGVVTSHSSTDTPPSGSSAPRRTVYDDVEDVRNYLPECSDAPPPQSLVEAAGIYSRLHAVGRLDADTTGVLLLTNDGGLVHHVTNPESKGTKVAKTYRATIMGFHVSPTEGGKLRELLDSGVDIGAKYGGITDPPLALYVLSHPTLTTTEVEITIAEGRNRQIRRMFHAIGSGVMKLHRVSIGETLDLRLPFPPKGGESTNARNMIPQGSWRVLTDHEVRQGLGWEPRVIALYPPRKRRRTANS